MMPANGITINMPKIQLSISLYIDKIKSKNFLVFLKKMPFYTWRPFNFKGLYFRVGNYLKVYRNSNEAVKLQGHVNLESALHILQL